MPDPSIFWIIFALLIVLDIIYSLLRFSFIHLRLPALLENSGRKTHGSIRAEIVGKSAVFYHGASGFDGQSCAGCRFLLFMGQKLFIPRTSLNHPIC